MNNKRKVVLLYTLIAYSLISFSVNFGFEYIVTLDEWAGLIIGILLMIASIPIYFIAKRLPLLYFISFLINMVGVGFSITCYYIFKQYHLEMIDFLTAFSVSMIVLIVFAVISSTSIYKKHPIMYTIFFILICFGVSLFLWLSEPCFSGLTFYYLNVAYFFMIGMIASSNDLRNLAKEMALVSFGAFVLVSIIVLLVITEGEALEGLADFSHFDIDISSKKKKR